MALILGSKERVRRNRIAINLLTENGYIFYGYEGNDFKKVSVKHSSKKISDFAETFKNPVHACNELLGVQLEPLD